MNKMNHKTLRSSNMFKCHLFVRNMLITISNITKFIVTSGENDV